MKSRYITDSVTFPFYTISFSFFDQEMVMRTTQYKINRLSASIHSHGDATNRKTTEIEFHLLRKDTTIMLNLPKSPVEADGFLNLTLAAKSPTSAISTDTPTKR